MPKTNNLDIYFGHLAEEIEKKLRLVRVPVRRTNPKPKISFNWDEFLANTDETIKNHGIKSLDVRTQKVIIRNWTRVPEAWIKEVLKGSPTLRVRWVNSLIMSWNPSEFFSASDTNTRRIKMVNWARENLPSLLAEDLKIKVTGLNWKTLEEKDLPKKISDLICKPGLIPNEIDEAIDILRKARLRSTSPICQAILLEFFWTKCEISETRTIDTWCSSIIELSKQGIYFTPDVLRAQQGAVYSETILYKFFSILIKIRIISPTAMRVILSSFSDTQFGDPRGYPQSRHWKAIEELIPNDFAEFLSELTKDDLEFFFRQDLLGENDQEREEFWLSLLEDIQRTTIIYPKKSFDKIRSQTKAGKFSEKQLNIISRSLRYNSESIAESNSNQAILVIYLKNQIAIEAAQMGKCRFYERDTFEKEILPKIFSHRISVTENLTVGVSSFRDYPDFYTKCKKFLLNELVHARGWQDKFREQLYGNIKKKRPITKKVDQDEEVESSFNEKIVTSDAENISGSSVQLKKAKWQIRVESFSTTSDIAEFLRKNGFTIIDRRPKNGRLWVLFHSDFDIVAGVLKQRYGFQFRYAEDSIALGGQPGWYLVEKTGF
jgi:hypothetical protein